MVETDMPFDPLRWPGGTGRHRPIVDASREWCLFLTRKPCFGATPRQQVSHLTKLQTVYEVAVH